MWCRESGLRDDVPSNSADPRWMGALGRLAQQWGPSWCFSVKWRFQRTGLHLIKYRTVAGKMFVGCTHAANPMAILPSWLQTPHSGTGGARLLQMSRASPVPLYGD